jgi:hypothetical protein
VTGGPQRRLFGSLQGYQLGWLRGDVIAGLTVWARYETCCGALAGKMVQTSAGCSPRSLRP